ncbi:MAG: bifunctional 4-hydroxy-2-oxoglutarate aldolase/2-dehydro-3-deoxy-phosphogluconate aldolase [Fibrobacter sp.]|nr:bifunctional 4-hydroxy-2-oxoglutarate aldolase/2-dehydro-3-deoxy-phosphogluconate aldolase [Fibrobacter sp.]
MSFLHTFNKNPYLGILRGITFEHIPYIVKASQNAELKLIEITMNTPQAPELIANLKQNSTELTIGAGTVCREKDLKQALTAGAEFIVSPAFQENIAELCQKQNIPYLPGALTPTEVQHAYHHGATMVKVFPVGAMGGPAYIKELRGPFAHIPLLACGGVNADNAKDYFAAGANAIAFGGSIFKNSLLNAESWPEVSTKIRSLYQKSHS